MPVIPLGSRGEARMVCAYEQSQHAEKLNLKLRLEVMGSRSELDR
jgi:hypothetical protein